MATTSTLTEPNQGAPHQVSPLLVSLGSMDRDAFEAVLRTVSEAFPHNDVLVASPDAGTSEVIQGVRVAGYTPSVPSTPSWTLTAADFVNSFELARKHEAQVILVLGPDAQTLDAATMRNLSQAVLEGNLDLALPHYDLPARAGLVNSAILYPITRALFGTRPRFPLALDLALSLRAAERLATTAQRATASGQPDAIIWPVDELAVAGFAIDEVEAGPRSVPQPIGQDLNSVLAQVAGSLFADVEAKAAFWQRARTAQPGRLTPPATSSPLAVSTDDAQPMIESFRLAYGNLHEIWSLVLPPQSLFGLKRLSVMPPSSFVMPDSLWARIVYDFLLAYRLRTINRGHLLGALTPLYLAWVASHILQTAAGTDPERHIEAAAAAFEADKPYLVSRWRWPDRFNP